MSLILDALNRSQQERDEQSRVPGIQTQHGPVLTPQADSWRRVLPWLGLVAALCIIAWLLFKGDSNAASTRANVPPAQSAAVVQAEIKQPVEAFPATTLQKKTKAAPVPEPIPERPATVVSLPQENSAVAALYTKGNEGSAAVAPRVETAPGNSPAVGSDPVKPEEKAGSEQEIDLEKMIALARREAENVELAEHPAPFLSELSQQVKDQIPTIYYSKHDFSGNSSQSSVTLNGEILRSGASVAGGIKLDEILPDSIILSHSGTQFRLKALNSWVNL